MHKNCGSQGQRHKTRLRINAKAFFMLKPEQKIYPMEEKSPDDKSISRQVIEMITVANEYCLFLEKAGQYSRQDILRYFQKVAPLLYLKGALLPAVPVNDPGVMERYVTEEQWETVFKALREQFKEIDVYYTLDHNNDSVESSLADNMADIYQDMKDFVMLYQKNTAPARQNAVEQLRDLFRWHWGPTLLSAMGRIHQVLHKEVIDPDLLDEDHGWLID